MLKREAPPGEGGRPIEEWQAQSPFFDHLGLTIDRNADDTSSVQVPWQQPLTNRKGDIHGGVVAAVLDTTLSHAVRFCAGEIGGISTVSLAVSYLAPARGSLVGTGRALRVGSTIGFAEGELVDESGQIVATAQGSFRIIRNRS